VTSLHVQALAEEVFETEVALSRAGGHTRRYSFGEVVSNAAYPHIYLANAILGFQATDWPAERLGAFFEEAIPHSPQRKLATTNATVRAGIEPTLLADGYRSEHKLAMVQVAAPEGSAPPAIAMERVVPPGWTHYDALVRESTAESSTPWLPAAVDEWIALKHWQAENLPLEWYVASEASEPVGRIGLFQHGFTARLQNVFVRHYARHRGVATAMLLAMTTRARQLGCQRLTLMCGLGSTLPEFYRRFGFRPVGEWYAWTRS
jgi:GNAT superfamily N-acetyltransferase